MSEIDYNARLYEKMKAEQDKYRDWLLHQEPSEILNHTYEYTMREDIVMCILLNYFNYSFLSQCPEFGGYIIFWFHFSFCVGTGEGAITFIRLQNIVTRV